MTATESKGKELTEKNRQSADYLESAWKASKLLKALEDEIAFDRATGMITPNSKLAKINRLQATMYLHEGDLGLVEKHLLLAFGYMKASFDEALNLNNAEMKKMVMPKIAQEHRRIVFIFALAKLSYHVTISEQLLQEIATALEAVTIPSLSGSKVDKLLLVVLSLAHYIRRTKLDFVDETEVVRLIEDRIMPSAVFDAEEYKTLQWLVVRIYQSVVKSRRRFATTDPEEASRLALSRELSAKVLKELGELTHAVDDLCESYLFHALSITKMNQLATYMSTAIADIERASKKLPYKKRYLDSIIVRMYIHAFNVSHKLTERTDYIAKAYELSASIGKKQKTIELAPYFYVTSFMNRLSKGTRTKSSLAAVQAEVIDFTSEITIDGDIDLQGDAAKTADLYKAATVLYMDQEYVPSGVEVLDSIHVLRKNGVIADNQLTEMLLRALSNHVNISVETFDFQEAEMVDDADSQNVQLLNTLLRNEESADVEVKLSDGALDKIVQTICSFSNTRGGKVMVGLIEKAYFGKNFPDKDIANYLVIANNFVLIGNKSFDSFRQKLSSKIKSHVKIIGFGKQVEELYSIEIVTVDKKQVLIVDVAPHFINHGMLCSYQNDIYTRHDNQNLLINANEVAEKLVNARVNNAHNPAA